MSVPVSGPASGHSGAVDRTPCDAPTVLVDRSRLTPGAIGRAAHGPDVPDLGLRTIPVDHHRRAVREGDRVRRAAVTNERVEEHLLAEASTGAEGPCPQLHPARAVARRVPGGLSARAPIEPDTECTPRPLREERDEAVLHGLLVVVEPAEVTARRAILFEGQPDPVGIGGIPEPLEGRGEQGPGAQPRGTGHIRPVHEVPSARQLPLRRLLGHGPLGRRGRIGVAQQDEPIGAAPVPCGASRHHRGGDRTLRAELRRAGPFILHEHSILNEHREASARWRRERHQLDLEPGIGRGAQGGAGPGAEEDRGDPREADAGSKDGEQTYPLSDQEAQRQGEERRRAEQDRGEPAGELAHGVVVGKQAQHRAPHADERRLPPHRRGAGRDEHRLHQAAQLPDGSAGPAEAGEERDRDSPAGPAHQPYEPAGEHIHVLEAAAAEGDRRTDGRRRAQGEQDPDDPLRSRVHVPGAVVCTAAVQGHEHHAREHERHEAHEPPVDLVARQRHRQQRRHRHIEEHDRRGGLHAAAPEGREVEGVGDREAEEARTEEPDPGVAHGPAPIAGESEGQKAASRHPVLEQVGGSGADVAAREHAADGDRGDRPASGSSEGTYERSSGHARGAPRSALGFFFALLRLGEDDALAGIPASEQILARPHADLANTTATTGGAACFEL